MTDLDRKIAEAKGWGHIPPSGPIFPGGRMGLSEGYAEPVPGQEERWFHLASECNWSTSDSKALELVDDFMRADTEFDWEFSLRFDNGFDLWECYFAPNGTDPRQIHTGRTRPEAICRAYLAAVEWMKARKE